MSDLTEFLLARIAEDERHATKLAETDRRPVLSLAMTVNHPERLLLECEAKRQIVEEATRQHTSSAEGYDILLIMATVYTDHPDYRESWRP